MQIGIITLFPEIFDALKVSVIARALETEKIKLFFWNPRDFTHDPYHRVDDRPYGGGPGMVMKYEPLQAAIHAAKKTLGEDTVVIYLSPQGTKWDQAVARDFSKKEKMILVAGRYEGIDERLFEKEINEEWSIGDYVLTGGELPAMVLIDSMARLLPGVLGDDASALQDSFQEEGLDCPHYTRPEQIDGLSVPPVLLSGNHEAIVEWRAQMAEIKTWQKRPDLIKRRPPKG